MKVKKLISSLSAISFLTISLAGYTSQNSSVCAYSNIIHWGNGAYTAEVLPERYRVINIYGKESMSEGTLSGFRLIVPYDEMLLPSVVEDSDDAEYGYGYDIAIMKLEHCDCSNIKSLILPNTMFELDMSQLENAQGLELLTIPSNITSIKGFDADSGYNFTIRGNVGSYAERFAKENNISFMLSGDIDADKDYSISDINQMEEYMFGKSVMKPVAEKSADMNFDKNLDIVDYIMLKNTVTEPPMSSCGASTADALAAPDMSSVKSEPCSASQISGYESFVADSSDEILLNSDSNNANPVYSPFSIYSALAMTAECASGNTQKEILDVLGADSIDTLRSDHSALFSSLYFDDFSAYCKISNSMWLNNRYTYNQNTLEDIADSYYAPSFSKDFSLKSVPDEISCWINKNTSGKITPSVPVKSDDILKIINTVTFKSQWVSPFSNSNKDIFTLSDKSTKECDFLSFESPEESVGFSDNFMKYSLPMKNGYNMCFILPDNTVSIADIISDNDTMDKIISDELDYQKRKLFFKVPKFNVYSSYDVIPAAKRLGINDAFGEKSDLTELIDYNENNIPYAYIDQIKHDTTLMIDEQGCEAAAYTMVSIASGCASLPENEPVYFYLDRPFFYYVSNSSGVPVFFGIINDPTQK